MKKFTKHVTKGTFLVVIYKICPDRQTKCDSGNKCCPTLHGESYSCCGFEKGVCCTDGMHCCPEGFTCNITSKTCRKKIGNVPMAIKEKAKSIKLFTILHSKKLVKRYETCPDEKHACPLTTRCCISNSGVYMCCPSGSKCNGGLYFFCILCLKNVHIKFFVVGFNKGNLSC